MCGIVCPVLSYLTLNPIPSGRPFKSSLVRVTSCRKLSWGMPNESSASIDSRAHGIRAKTTSNLLVDTYVRTMMRGNTIQWTKLRENTMIHIDEEFYAYDDAGEYGT